MKKFTYVAPLRGLQLVTIDRVTFDTNSRGEYIDIIVSKDNRTQHILNNVNSDTENYIIAQLCNAATQLGLEDMESDELLKSITGKTLEIEINANGFHIFPERRLEYATEEDNI